MVLNKKILTQKKFSQLHRYLLAFFLLYLMERFAQSNSTDYVWPFVIIIPVFTVDLLLSIKNYMNSRNIIYMLRFIEISVAAGYTIVATAPYNLGLSVLCLVLFFSEYVMAFDFEDIYYRTIAVLTGSIPLVTLLIIDAVITREVKERLFPISCIFILLVVFCTFVITL